MENIKFHQVQVPTLSELRKILRGTSSKIEPIKTYHYSSTEDYLLHRIAELEEEVEMYKKYITENQIQWQPIINPVTNEVVAYKTDKRLEEICENANENEDGKDITDREKELREKIASECIKKGWIGDIYTAQSKDYDFITCPDNFKCLQNYTFSALCDETSDTYPCEECWKKFLRGGIC